MSSNLNAWKAMLKACVDNDSDKVQYYLDEGVDPNYQHPEYRTSPFLEAVRCGNIRCVNALLSSGASLTEIEDRSGMTPLELALYERQHAVVDILLSKLSSRDKSAIWTILVSGRLPREVLRKLASTGHIILIDDDDMTSDIGLIQDLQFATENRKLKWANMVSRELVNVTHWIITEREDSSNYRILDFILEYYPLMPNLKRMLILTEKDCCSIELSWLLRKNQKVVGLKVPTWWNQIMDRRSWLKWEQMIWWLLTTHEDVKQTLYGYDKKINEAASSSTNHIIENLLNNKFRKLIVGDQPFVYRPFSTLEQKPKMFFACIPSSALSCE
jgi:uncharacterized protein